MNTREEIRKVTVDAKIYDLGLAEMVKNALEGEAAFSEEKVYFGLDVVFDKSVYREAAFYQYPVSKEAKGPKPKTERERLKQRIYNVLSEQLDKIAEALEQTGFCFGHTSIIGDDLDREEVQIILYRETLIESGGRGKQTIARVTSIMPDRPYIIEQAGKVFAEMALKHIKEENLKEAARRNHVPNWVPAYKLFSAVAAALAVQSIDDAGITANKILSGAVMESDWPLHIRSKNRGDHTEPMTGETQIDCPEYMLIRLNHGGSWELEKVEGLKEAQQIMSRQGFRNKQTKTIVVLQNLEPVPYVLFAETDVGLTPVTQAEAHAHKKIHVNWNRRSQCLN